MQQGNIEWNEITTAYVEIMYRVEDQSPLSGGERGDYCCICKVDFISESKNQTTFFFL